MGSSTGTETLAPAPDGGPPRARLSKHLQADRGMSTLGPSAAACHAPARCGLMGRWVGGRRIRHVLRARTQALRPLCNKRQTQWPPGRRHTHGQQNCLPCARETRARRAARRARSSCDAGGHVDASHGKKHDIARTLPNSRSSCAPDSHRRLCRGAAKLSQSCPKVIHKLFDRQISAIRRFLACSPRCRLGFANTIRRCRPNMLAG